MRVACWIKHKLLTFFSLFFILLWLLLDFTAGLLLYLSPCGIFFPSSLFLKSHFCLDIYHVCAMLSFFHLCQYWTVGGKKCSYHVQLYRSHSTAFTIILSPLLPLLSVSFPGSQLYHSAVCVLVQFLMLRLMGRTVTTVLSSFTFQLVRCPCLLFSFFMRPGLQDSNSSHLCTARHFPQLSGSCLSYSAYFYICTLWFPLISFVKCQHAVYTVCLKKTHSLTAKADNLSTWSHACCTNAVAFVLASSCFLQPQKLC